MYFARRSHRLPRKRATRLNLYFLNVAFINPGYCWLC